MASQGVAGHLLRMITAPVLPPVLGDTQGVWPGQRGALQTQLEGELRAVGLGLMAGQVGGI